MLFEMKISAKVENKILIESDKFKYALLVYNYQQLTLLHNKPGSEMNKAIDIWTKI